MKLKVFDVLNSTQRISSIDVFRCMAIIPVVMYHFGYFPYGYLGVDLFFVISGFLVGSILIKKIKNGSRILFFEFILQRGFKIWPSYYSFLFFGSLLAVLFYKGNTDQFIIPLDDFPRYIFFYQNYTGTPVHWTFDHVWSLCVEEHFYILLPVLFIIIRFISSNKISRLTIGVVSLIILGILGKIVSLEFTNSKDTYSSTHNRIDALGWGVLLGIIITYYGEQVRKLHWRKYLFIAGLLLFSLNLLEIIFVGNYYYDKVVFHSLSPVCFFLMILGVYYYDFSAWKPFRFIAYYSYNWYLWHPIFTGVVARYFDHGIIGLFIYLFISFLMAFFSTLFIEERFLKLREKVLPRIFKRTSAVPA